MDPNEREIERARWEGTVLEAINGQAYRVKQLEDKIDKLVETISTLREEVAEQKGERTHQTRMTSLAWGGGVSLVVTVIGRLIPN